MSEERIKSIKERIARLNIKLANTEEDNKINIENKIDRAVKRLNRLEKK